MLDERSNDRTAAGDRSAIAEATSATTTQDPIVGLSESRSPRDPLDRFVVKDASPVSAVDVHDPGVDARVVAGRIEELASVGRPPHEWMNQSTDDARAALPVDADAVDGAPHTNARFLPSGDQDGDRPSVRRCVARPSRRVR